MPTAGAGPIRPLFGEDPARLAQCLQGRDDLVPILVPLEMLAVSTTVARTPTSSAQRPRCCRQLHRGHLLTSMLSSARVARERLPDLQLGQVVRVPGGDPTISFPSEHEVRY